MSREPLDRATTEPIRVLLVEDHSAFRQALALTLAFEPDIRVVGQARSMTEARCLIRSGTAIDVAVLDLDLPDGHGADLIHELHAVHPAAHALVLTANTGHRVQAEAVEAGAAGALHKSVEIDEIVSAIRRLATDGWLLSSGELAKLLRDVRAGNGQQRTASLPRLTPRERDVLALLGEGLSDKEIGVRLRVGKDTVHTHMVNLLGKLGAESRLQALVIAVRQGLISIERETRGARDR
jgi:DNA-binding NarL/FixJ family response regulator